MNEEAASQRLSETPSGVKLASLDTIPDGTARNFVLQMRAGRFHGFVVRRGDSVHGYVDRCPHMQLPLAQRLDDYLTSTGPYILCSWHGALFDIHSGACIGGPCAGQRLTPWPLHVDLGMVITGLGKPTAAPR